MLRIILLISAFWLTLHSAVITWHGAGCVYRNQTLIACDLRDVGHRIVLGEANTDAAYRPACNDVYTLIRPDGSTENARLLCRALLPVWRG